MSGLFGDGDDLSWSSTTCVDFKTKDDDGRDPSASGWSILLLIGKGMWGCNTDDWWLCRLEYRPRTDKGLGPGGKGGGPNCLSLCDVEIEGGKVRWLTHGGCDRGGRPGRNDPKPELCCSMVCWLGWLKSLKKRISVIQ